MSDAEVTTPHPEQDALTVGDEAAAGLKRKRVVLSIHDKQQVLLRLQGGEQPIAIAREFGISRQQVSDIKKNRERIVAFCTDAKHMSTLKRKTLKATCEFHPGVEQELYRWIIRQRRLGRAVTPESLTSKTTDLFVQYSDARVSFKTATNWLRHFKNAHGIKTMSHEEMQQLPEQFVPAMDMARPGDVASAQMQAPVTGATSVVTRFGHPEGYSTAPVSRAMHQVGGPPSVAQTGTTTTAGGQTALDVNPCVQAVGGHGHVPLQATVNTVQQLNAQLARFERDMAVKLDYLDERVAKLCFLVLPSRLS
ncbi:hypothetical protein PRIC2_013633 [Phytophthora ramorum]|uniref:HTH CENPB-type domain-containing protein n=1 Tax=Phytophthora ramorum TaxID=164328 RepID=H3GLI9_PHYRM